MTQPECRHVNDESTMFQVVQWFGNMGISAAQAFAQEVALAAKIVRPPERLSASQQISASDGIAFLAEHGARPLLPHIGARRQ